MSGARAPDFFYREAQRLGYVARSAFKLLQMQKQYKLITPGASVLDLGCAPGAWLQVACQSLGPVEKGGSVVGVDLKKVKVPSQCDARVRTVCADVMSLLKEQAKAMSPQGSGFSVILSDMCPMVSGITTKDAALSCELGMRALSLAVGSDFESGSDTDTPDTGEGGALQRGGNLVIKLLESEDIQDFSKFCKPRFKRASWLRPKATRSCSREIYLICQGCGGRGRRRRGQRHACGSRGERKEEKKGKKEKEEGRKEKERRRKEGSASAEEQRKSTKSSGLGRRRSMPSMTSIKARISEKKVVRVRLGDRGGQVPAGGFSS